jgi:predicted DNA-binding transcriptional regulator AlpA
MFRVTLIIITAAALVLTAVPPADVAALIPHTMVTVDHIDAVVAAAAILGVRAERVIRLHELPDFLGVQRSQVNEAIKKGLLHPRPAYPGARAMVVTESEVAALQAAAAAEAQATTTAPAKEIAPNRKRRLARAATDESATAQMRNAAPE